VFEKGTFRVNAAPRRRKPFRYCEGGGETARRIADNSNHFLAGLFVLSDPGAQWLKCRLFP
jgi:hypothetical protein